MLITYTRNVSKAKLQDMSDKVKLLTLYALYILT